MSNSINLINSQTQKDFSLHSNQVNKSIKYQANSHLQYCQMLSITVQLHLGQRHNDQHLSNQFSKKTLRLIKEITHKIYYYMSTSHSILHYTTVKINTNIYDNNIQDNHQDNINKYVKNNHHHSLHNIFNDFKYIYQ